MKKAITILLVIGLTFGALSAPATAGKKKKKAPKPRKVEGTYEGPAAGVPGIASSCSAGGCVYLQPLPHESFVSLELVDDSGAPAAAALSQDTDGDGTGEIFGAVCGKTEEPIAIAPGVELRVIIGTGFVFSVDNPPGCPSAATTGTVKGIFSATP